jgi:hypothetical protein
MNAKQQALPPRKVPKVASLRARVHEGAPRNAAIAASLRVRMRARASERAEIGSIERAPRHDMRRDNNHKTGAVGKLFRLLRQLPAR